MQSVNKDTFEKSLYLSPRQKYLFQSLEDVLRRVTLNRAIQQNVSLSCDT